MIDEVPSYRNLVFEGGGVKGIAYVGALDELDDHGLLDGIERVGGASAGAITATLLALGYDTEGLETAMEEMEMEAFMDDSPGVILDGARLLERYGWYKGEAFREWMGERIKGCTGDAETTFEELASTNDHPDLYLVATNLSTGYSEIFSHEHTPDTAVVDAVRTSMAIPVFFASEERDGCVYVDGGLLNNYPVKLFDRRAYVDEDALGGWTPTEPEYYDDVNEEVEEGELPGSRYVFNRQTLGFRLDTSEEIAAYRDRVPPEPDEISNLADYLQQLAGTILDLQSRRHLHADDWKRTVYIDTADVGTTDFDLGNRDICRLVCNGYMGAQEYLDWLADEGW